MEGREGKGRRGTPIWRSGREREGEEGGREGGDATSSSLRAFFVSGVFWFRFRFRFYFFLFLH